MSNDKIVVSEHAMVGRSATGLRAYRDAFSLTEAVGRIIELERS
jgi:hypothetical protein